MGPIEFFSQPLWQRWAYSLMHLLWQGVVIAFLLIVLVKMLDIRRPSIRYSILLCGLLFMAVCPIVTFLITDIPLTGINESVITEHNNMPLSISSDSFSKPFPDENILKKGKSPDTAQTTALLIPNQNWYLSWIQSAQPYLLFGWLGGVFLLSLRLLMSVIGIRGLQRDRQPISVELIPRIRSLATNLGFDSVPRIFATRRIQEAVVVGFFRPMVLLPTAWLMELSPQVLEAVIAHELSHIRRWDLWANLFQRFVETLFFYHPVVWWLSRQIRLEREKCCDELAVTVTGERVAYATALEEVARRRFTSSLPTLAAGMGCSNRALLLRVQNILGIVQNQERSFLWPVGLISLIFIASISLISYFLNQSDHVLYANENLIVTNQVQRELTSQTSKLLDALKKDPADEQPVMDALKVKGAEFRKNKQGLVIAIILNDAQVNDADLISLKDLREIDTLNLRGSRINSESLLHLKDLPKLRTLLLSRSKITDESMTFISQLDGLRDLELSYTSISDTGLIHLKNMAQLQQLQLNDNEITDAGLVHLNGLINLRQLSLHQRDTGGRKIIKITDAGLVNLKRLTKLRTLNLSYSQIGDAGLAQLNGLTALEELALTGTNVGDAGLQELKALEKLYFLELTDTKVTDAGLVHIKDLPLRNLGLNRTAISDRGISHIAKLRQLRKLWIGGTQVSTEGFAQLKHVFPEADIYERHR